jgi:hypothetical protein
MSGMNVPIYSTLPQPRRLVLLKTIEGRVFLDPSMGSLEHIEIIEYLVS